MFTSPSRNRAYTVSNDTSDTYLLPPNADTDVLSTHIQQSHDILFTSPHRSSNTASSSSQLNDNNNNTFPASSPSSPHHRHLWHLPLSPRHLSLELDHSLKQSKTQRLSLLQQQSKKRMMLEQQLEGGEKKASTRGNSKKNSRKNSSMNEELKKSIIEENVQMESSTIIDESEVDDDKENTDPTNLLSKEDNEDKSDDDDDDDTSSSPDLQLHHSSPISLDPGCIVLSERITQSAPSLTSLSAYLSDISTHGATAFAEALYGCVKLRTMELRLRRITQSESIAVLMTSISLLTRLTDLTLRCAELGDHGTKMLCEAFISMQKNGGGGGVSTSAATNTNTNLLLRSLDLQENAITDTSCESLGELIMYHPSLTLLNLEQNRIGVQGARVLGKALTKWQMSKKSAAAASEEAVTPLCDITTRQNRSMSDCTFTSPRATQSNSIHQTPKRLQSHAQTPQAQQTPSRSSSTTAAAGGHHPPFPIPIPSTPRVRSASASSRSDATVGAGGCGGGSRRDLQSIPESQSIVAASPSFIAESMAAAASTTTIAAPTPPSHPSALLHLNLRNNKIDIEEMDGGVESNSTPASTTSSSASTISPHAILARYLTISPDTSGLTHIDFSLNKLGDFGAMILARSLAHNGSLTHLNLTFCSISDTGGIALSRSLAFNSSLKSFYLGINHLTSDTTDVLSDSLYANNTLTVLDLSVNLLNDQAFRNISAALTLNTTLQQLDLHGNWMTDDVVEEVLEVVKYNTTLKNIDVEENPSMTEERKEKVRDALMATNRGEGRLQSSQQEFSERRTKMQRKIASLVRSAAHPKQTANFTNTAQTNVRSNSFSRGLKGL